MPPHNPPLLAVSEDSPGSSPHHSNQGGLSGKAYHIFFVSNLAWRTKPPSYGGEYPVFTSVWRDCGVMRMDPPYTFDGHSDRLSPHLLH